MLFRSEEGAALDLTDKVQDGLLTTDIPEGVWRIHVNFVTTAFNYKPEYINYIEADSVRLLIDEVYEKHYERYGELFGSVIAGFFSDEPGFYNTDSYGENCFIGLRMPLPWGRELENMLLESYGKTLYRDLALLFADHDDKSHRALRVAYMNAVSRLYGKNFTAQLGDWCRAHADTTGQYCIVGFALDNTLSENGTVSRGICSYDQQGNLTDIAEEDGFDTCDNTEIDAILGYEYTLDTESVGGVTLGADYIATHPDLTCPVEWGNAPDIGLVIHDLKVCTGREPLVIGKPQPQMVYSALERYGAAPEDTVLIGDRLYTDLACGENAGIDTILVLSGEGTEADCEKYGVHPTWIMKDIAAVLSAMKRGEL